MLLALAVLAPLTLTLASPSGASPGARPAGVAQAAAVAGDANGYVRGRSAIARLGDRLPAVARERGMSRAALRAVLLADPTLAVDRSLQLAYFDKAADAGATDVTPQAQAAPATTGPEFALASLPGAAKTIYLDFDGHTTTGTSWNSGYGIETIQSPPYDTDGDASTFSATELAVIRNAYEVVAEDFAPWNVNVTTIDPGTEALRRSGTGDTQWGVRVVVTDDTFAGCGCGGHAYVGAFDDATDEPAFVYNSSTRGVAEAATHEVGHTMLLAHDGTTTGEAYYRGHGSGETGWGPIMGASYGPATVQWSQQEYTGANNTGSAANYNNGADDIAIISSLTNGNNFGVRTDDHGSSASTATALTGPSATVAGRISTRTDVDAFRVSVAAGPVSFVVTPKAAPNGNLDVGLTVRNAAGQVVATADTPDAHAASYSATLPAGDYTVTVDGVGAGSPTATPPTGYTDYGSLGTYSLTARFTPATSDPPPPAGATATGELAVGGSVTGSYVDTQSADGRVQSITEVSSGGKPSSRHDTLEHRWSFPATTGSLTLALGAAVADGGDADAGVHLEWSRDGGASWLPVTTLSGTVDTSYPLGSASGPVWVRVLDTDSTPGQLRPDAVRVDLLRLEAQPLAPATRAVVSGLVAGTKTITKSSTAGTATVTVIDEHGVPVRGAVVGLRFSGDFTVSPSVTTDSTGTARYTTAPGPRRPTFEVCVVSVDAGSLTWSGGPICRAR